MCIFLLVLHFFGGRGGGVVKICLSLQNHTHYILTDAKFLRDRLEKENNNFSTLEKKCN